MASASQSPQGKHIYRGNFVHTPAPNDLAILHDHCAGVTEDGKIAFLVPRDNLTEALVKLNWQDLPSISTVTAPKNGFFFPGFIDTHTHAPQYPNTGIFGSSTLLDWLNTYTFPMESSFKDLDRARQVYTRVVRRGLSHGTTCAAYHATLHVEATNTLADICKAAGQRALVGRVCMDSMSPEGYRDESPLAAVEASTLCIQHARKIDPSGEIVRPCITPRFAPSCTEESLLAMGELQKATGEWAQTHMSENLPELAMVKDIFPQHKDYASVYESAGLLNDKTILAHAIHLSADELKLISANGVKISHCPISNTCLTSGACRVRELLDAGVDVGLGTDMSGGYSPSILEIARQAILVSRHVAMQHGDHAKLSVEEALYLATKGGARCVGLENVVGGFEETMDWDAQLICLGENVAAKQGGEENQNLNALPNIGSDESPVDVFGWESLGDQIAKWVYTGDDRNVQAVWVKGKLVHQASSKFQGSS
ncbi:MAG: hypothetical protein M1831_000409 [Alyxoria varia]|nr:MAG: hypothetical protein M1831_000409 [Alyxoria varia]